MKGYKTIISAGFAALMLSSTAFAAQYTENGAGPFALSGGITDTFSGPAVLSRTCFGIPINLNCTLTLGGQIVESGANVNLSISSAASTGGGGLITCADVSFSGFPWTGSTATTNLPTSFTDTTPVPFTVSGIVVNTPCGSCSGSVTASYSNTGLGEFGFVGTMGSCSVNGSGIDSVAGTSYRVSQ